MKQRLNIKCMEHLASRLGCNEALLDALKNGMKQACKVKIINRKGKLRKVVDAVDPRLKEIQTRILGLLNNLSLSSNAHGWIKKRSIKTNAIPHCGNPAKLCLDLKDCYPNVPSMRIRRLFEEELGCSPQVSSVLTRLTTYDFCLSQGFSTSGALLNLVFRPIDALLKSYANQYSLQYSRYGDDLTFSGIFIPEFFKRNIKRIITQHNFILNDKKEEFTQGNFSPLVTGINTSGPTPKVPREFKRRLRAAEHELSVKEMDAGERENLQNSIKGRKNYITYIESY
ncbi:reverse transcriptase family protein [Bilophila wadsworthia]|uniref:reverse transcriptase family protein n=1 Tax=Bilophila wadsworthia TaxID=35833 RepID=UPI003AB3BD98